MQGCYYSVLIIMVSLFLGAPARALDNEEALFQSALSAYQSNNLSSCVKQFYFLARANPQKGLYWFNLGNCLFMGGAYKKSIIAYGKVVKLQSPLAPVAVLNQARGYVKLGRPARARFLLRSLREKPLPPGLRGEIALELYELGLYEDAEEQIQLIPPPLDNKIQLLLGLSLIKQNKNSEAEKTLRGLSVGALSVEDKASVRSLLAGIKTSAWSSRSYGLFFDLAYGSTSNAFLEGRSFAPVSSSLVRASLGAHYRYFQRSSWSQNISYLWDYDNPTIAPELSTQMHSIQLPVVYQNRLLEMGLTPYVSAQLWDGSMAFQKTGAIFRVAILPQGIWGGGCDIDGASQKGSDDTKSYLSGSFYSARSYVSFNPGAWSFQLSWVIGRDGTQDIFYSDGSLLPLEHTYQGPGARVRWQISEASSLALQVLALERSYKTNSLPEDKHRQDQEIDASLKYSYRFSRGWMVYGLVEYNPNKSTLVSDDVRDKNYDNTNALVGIGWDVF